MLYGKENNLYFYNLYFSYSYYSYNLYFLIKWWKRSLDCVTEIILWDNNILSAASLTCLLKKSAVFVYGVRTLRLYI